MPQELSEESKSVGFEIDWKKTKVISNAKKAKVELERIEVDWEDEFVYLGQKVSFKNEREEELKARFFNDWKKYWSQGEVFKREMLETVKSHIWSSCVQHSTYIQHPKRDIRKLQNTQTAIERSMIEVHKTEKIQNLDIKRKINLIIVRYTVTKVKWKYEGGM